MKVNKREVLVLGLGASGRSAALLLMKHGARVTVSEARRGGDLRKITRYFQDKGVTVALGGHPMRLLKNKDLIVKSPGISGQKNILIEARKRRIPIISEIELGSLISPENIIAVTGTNGKTTTATLIGNILKTAKISHVVCGNIGKPFTETLLSRFGKPVKVIEVSSFQLEDCRRFRPHIGICLNITPDHLDRHVTLAAYAQEKFRLFRNQNKTDYAVLNWDDPLLRRMSGKLKSRIVRFSLLDKRADIYLKGSVIYRNFGKRGPIADLGSMRVTGAHNQANMVAASVGAILLGVKPQTIAQSLKGFKGLPHRCETIRTFKGVRYINDSKSTTVASTQAAVSSIVEKIVLIAGGIDKGNDYSTADDVFASKVAHLIVYGRDRKKIIKHFKGIIPVVEAKSLKDALRSAYRRAGRGSAVLLSPMCASFDMFKNYDERGEKYRSFVFKLK